MLYQTTILEREQSELQKQKNMRYEIDKITENELLREVLFLLHDDISHQDFATNYQNLRQRYPITDHRDPMWMVYLSLSEHAAGAISHDTALDQIIEHARDAGLITQIE